MDGNGRPGVYPNRLVVSLLDYLPTDIVDVTLAEGEGEAVEYLHRKGVLNGKTDRGSLIACIGGLSDDAMVDLSHEAAAKLLGEDAVHPEYTGRIYVILADYARIETEHGSKVGGVVTEHAKSRTYKIVDGRCVEVNPSDPPLVTPLCERAA